MTIVWGIVLALLGLIHWGPVLVAGLTIASITYGALLGVFLLGTWNRRANETGALVGFHHRSRVHDWSKTVHAAGMDLVRSGGHDRNVRCGFARQHGWYWQGTHCGRSSVAAHAAHLGGTEKFIAIPAEAKPKERLELVRGLGAWAAAAIVVGTMIGTGIFLKPAEMASTGGSTSVVSRRGSSVARLVCSVR